MLKQLNQLSFFSLLVIINLQKQDFEKLINFTVWTAFRTGLVLWCFAWNCVMYTLLCAWQMSTIDAGLRSIESIESMESGKGMDLEVAICTWKTVKNCENSMFFFLTEEGLPSNHAGDHFVPGSILWRFCCSIFPSCNATTCSSWYTSLQVDTIDGLAKISVLVAMEIPIKFNFERVLGILGAMNKFEQTHDRILNGYTCCAQRKWKHLAAVSLDPSPAEAQ